MLLLCLEFPVFFIFSWIYTEVEFFFSHSFSFFLSVTFFIVPSALVSLHCPLKPSSDALIAAFLCLFCLTQSLWALYKCPAQFLPLPSPSTSPSHSAILRASLVTSSVFLPLLPPQQLCWFNWINILLSFHMSGSLTSKRSSTDTSFDTARHVLTHADIAMPVRIVCVYCKRIVNTLTYVSMLRYRP